MTDQDPNEILRAMISDPDAEVTPELRRFAAQHLELVLEELLLTRQGYESWRTAGRSMNRALLDIWHMAEPSDTSHMSYGDDPETVVAAVRALGKTHRFALKQSVADTFEFVLESCSAVAEGEGFENEKRSSSPEWKLGYQASAADISDHLRHRISVLRSEDSAE